MNKSYNIIIGRLGAKEQGVSKPIEVVVRPTGVGLGFGDITEASQLKTNKIIVRILFKQLSCHIS